MGFKCARERDKTFFLTRPFFPGIKKADARNWDLLESIWRPTSQIPYFGAFRVCLSCLAPPAWPGPPLAPHLPHRDSPRVAHRLPLLFALAPHPSSALAGPVWPPSAAPTHPLRPPSPCPRPGPSPAPREQHCWPTNVRPPRRQRDHRNSRLQLPPPGRGRPPPRRNYRRRCSFNEEEAHARGARREV